MLVHAYILLLLLLLLLPPPPFSHFICNKFKYYHSNTLFICLPSKASRSSSNKRIYPTISRKEEAIAIKAAEQVAIKKEEEKYEAFVDDRKAYSGKSIIHLCKLVCTLF